MTIGTIIAGCLPLFVDLSPSHVLNPTWPAHARLHEVWLLASGALFSLVTLYLIWVHRGERRRALGAAAVVMGCLLTGFFIAAGTASQYGGVLVDPLTAPSMPNQDMAFGVPANLLAFGLAFVLLLVGAALARAAQPSATRR